MASPCDSLSLYATCNSADPDERRAGLRTLAAFLYPVARYRLNTSQYDDFAVQECTQSALIAIHQQLQNQKGPDAPQSFCAWAARIAINKCLDRIRHDQRRPTEPLEQIAEAPSSNEILPQHIVELNETRAELLLSIQQHAALSDDSKTTLIQGYFWEKTDQEIADMLAKKAANVRLIRHRNLEKLRNDDDFCTQLGKMTYL
ncbi:MAG: sigma-70 family RNA polymerase sigma factor [Caldilineaceae bacterium]|nr:sigma-70 family RNA polymerase sigma factor [Caldilineaceae bacterium]